MHKKSDQHSVKLTQSTSASTHSSPPFDDLAKGCIIQECCEEGVNAIAKPLKVKQLLLTCTLSSTAGYLNDQPNFSGDSPNSPSHIGTPDPDEVIELSNSALDTEKGLGKSSSTLTLWWLSGLHLPESLKRTWCPPIYSIFKDNVLVQHHQG